MNYPDLAYWIMWIISDFDNISPKTELHWTDSCNVLLDSLVERRSIRPVLIRLEEQNMSESPSSLVVIISHNGSDKRVVWVRSAKQVIDRLQHC